MTRPNPRDFRIADAQYPTQRVQLPDGYYFEIMPLVLGRSRITITDGRSVPHFW